MQQINALAPQMGHAAQLARSRLEARLSQYDGILDRLEEKGMVERSVSGADARRRFITLTEKGREQQALFRKNFRAAEERMLRGLTPEEVETFRSLLGRIIQNLEEDQIP